MKPRADQNSARTRLLERFHASVDHGDGSRAQRLLEQIEAVPDPDSAFARWRLLATRDDLSEALETIQEGVHAFPKDPDLRRALGWTLLETGAAEAAIEHLQAAVGIDPQFADAWHDLALAREATSDLDGMQEAFRQVYAIDTAPSVEPARYRPEEVMAWAELAIRGLPKSVQAVIPDLPIFVQDYPDDWILDESPFDPRLLGLFDGPTYADVHSSNGAAISPCVYLFQRNLERLCPGSREMAEQVRITLHHEVGHFLGLDEDELHKRGLG